MTKVRYTTGNVKDNPEYKVGDRTTIETTPLELHWIDNDK
mgnify:CR=1 FL=1